MHLYCLWHVVVSLVPLILSLPQPISVLLSLFSRPLLLGVMVAHHATCIDMMLSSLHSEAGDHGRANQRTSQDMCP